MFPDDDPVFGLQPDAPDTIQRQVARTQDQAIAGFLEQGYPELGQPANAPDPEDEDNRGFLKKLGVSLYRGGLKAVDETMDFLASIGPGFTGNIAASPMFQNIISGGAIETPDVPFAGEKGEGTVLTLPKAAEGLGWQLTEGAAQFIPGMIGAQGITGMTIKGTYRALRNRGVSQGLARFGAITAPPTVSGAVADFVVWDPEDPNVATMLAGLDELDYSGDGWFTQYVSKPLGTSIGQLAEKSPTFQDEDDTELERRLQNLVEGGALGLVLDATMVGIRKGLQSARVMRAQRAGQIAEQEAATLLQRIRDSAEDISDAIEVIHDGQGNSHAALRTTGGDWTPNPEGLVEDAIKRMHKLSTSLAPDYEANVRKMFDPQQHRFLWHTSVAQDGVNKQALMFGADVGKKGLGGGGQTISMTWDRAKAEFIETYFQTAQRIASYDEIDPSEVLQVWGDLERGMDNPFYQQAEEAHRFIADWMGPREADEVMGFVRDQDGQLMDYEDWLYEEFTAGEIPRWDFNPEDINPVDRLEAEMEWERLTDSSPEGIDARFDEVFQRFVDEDSHFEFRGGDDREFMGELTRYLDRIQSNPDFRNFSDDDTVQDFLRRFEDVEYEDIGISQVVIRKDAPWASFGHKAPGEGQPRIGLNPDERELFVYGEGAENFIETVERIQIKGDQHAEAVNHLLKRRMQGVDKVSTKKLHGAVQKLVKMEMEGIDPRSNKYQRELGLNLGLYVKSYPDFTKVSAQLAEVFHRELRADRARARDGNPQSTWAAMIERSEAWMNEALGFDLSLGGIREAVKANLRRDVPQDVISERIWAFERVATAMAEDVTRTARAMDLAPDGSATRANLGATMTSMTETLAEVVSRVAGLRSEVGRTFNELKAAGRDLEDMARDRAISRGERKAAKAELAAVEDEIVQVKEHLSTQELFANMKPQDLMNFARNLVLADGDLEKVIKAVTHAAQPPRFKILKGAWEKLNWFRVSMMLSGPRTHMINVLNNAMVAAELPVEYWWAGVRSKDAALRQQGTDLLVGHMMHLKDAFAGAWQALKLNRNIIDPSTTHRVDDMGVTGLGRPGYATPNGGPLARSVGAFKFLVDIPGRALMTGDEFFKQLNYRSHVRSQALKVGRDLADGKGLTGKAYDDFVADYAANAVKNTINDQGAGTVQSALDFAAYATFTNDLPKGSLGNTIQVGIQKHPSVHFAIPFVRTPMNLLKFAHERTPLINQLHQGYLDDLAAGGQRAAIARARNDVGKLIWGTAAIAFLEGRLTGRGPEQHELRSQWMDAGWQPYSIRPSPTDDWISYARIEPFATAFGMVADGMEVASQHDDETLSGISLAVISAVSANLTSKTYLKGLSDALEILTDSNAGKKERTLRTLVGSFWPNFLNQINTDPYIRESRSFIEEIQKRTPGWSKNVEPKRNIFGEPVMKPPMAFGMDFSPFANNVNRTMNPFVTMRMPEDRILQRKFVEIGKAMPYPEPTRMNGNIDLRDREKWDNGTNQSPYDFMFEWVRSEFKLREKLEGILGQQGETFDKLPPGNDLFPGGTQHDVPRMLIQNAYNQAFFQALEAYPSLKKEYYKLTGIKEIPGAPKTLEELTGG